MQTKKSKGVRNAHNMLTRTYKPILIVFIFFLTASLAEAIELEMADNNFIVDQSGNVGIGTTSPVSKLNIAAGNIKLWPFRSIQWGGSDDASWNWALRYSGIDEDIMFSRNNSTSIPFLIKGDSGNVGIGAIIPGAKLHIRDTNNWPQFSIENTADSETSLNFFNTQRIWTIGQDSSSGPNDGFFIYDNSAGKHRLVIDTNGYVGIGTTSPMATLHVKGSRPSGQTPTNVTGLFVENGGALGGSFVFQTASLGGGKSFSITDAGYVGIGTTIPKTKLQIDHDGGSTYGMVLRLNQNAIGNADGPKIEFYKNMTSPKTWSAGILNGFDVGDFVISEDGGYATGFGNPRLTIQTGGNVGIGTVIPEAQLTVVDENNAGIGFIEYNNLDGANFRGKRARGTIASPLAVQAGDRISALTAFGYDGTDFVGTKASVSLIAAETFTPTATGAYITLETTPIGGTAPQERVRIDPSGNVGIGTTTPGNWKLYINGNACSTGTGDSLTACSSDQRLKDNIKPLSNALGKLTQLQPVSFQWNKKAEETFGFKKGQKDMGLIAQEVEKIFPEWVSTNKNGYKRVLDGELRFMMLQAIKELKSEKDAEIKELKEIICSNDLEADFC